MESNTIVQVFPNHAFLFEDTGERDLVLVAYGNGSCDIKDIYLSRDQSGRSIFLGRNDECGMTEYCRNVIYISRRHIAVTIADNGTITISSVSSQENIASLNGSILSGTPTTLNVGFRFSLLHSMQWFNYVLVCGSKYLQVREMLHEASNSTSSTPVPFSLKRSREEDTEEEEKNIEDSNKVAKIVEDFNNNKDLEDDNIVLKEDSEDKELVVKQSVVNDIMAQFDCAICYSTMAATCTLTPCGCNFCYVCIEKWSATKNTCPCCNQKFDLGRASLNKGMDSAILALFKARQMNLKHIKSWENRGIVGIQRKQAYKQIHQPTTKMLLQPSAYVARRQREENDLNARIIHIDGNQG